MPLNFKAAKVEAMKAMYQNLTSPTGQESQHIHAIHRSLGESIPLIYLKKALISLAEEELIRRDVEPQGTEYYFLEEEGILVTEQRLLAEVAIDSNVIVPASDRLVPINHNEEPVPLILDTLSAIETELRTSNSVGEAFGDEKDAALAEVGALKRMLDAAALRARAFLDAADGTLRWIAEKGVGAVVGELAKIALKHIIDWLT